MKAVFPIDGRAPMKVTDPRRRRPRALSCERKPVGKKSFSVCASSSLAKSRTASAIGTYSGIVFSRIDEHRLSFLLGHHTIRLAVCLIFPTPAVEPGRRILDVF